MFVNPSQAVSCCSSFFSPSPQSSLSLSLSRRFELDNENNEFGVCFSLCVCRALPQLLSLHLARPLSLSFSPLALTPCHTLFPMPEPPTHTHTHTVTFLKKISFPCMSPVLFCSLSSPLSDIRASLHLAPHSVPAPFSPSLIPLFHLSVSPSVFLCDFMPQLLYYQSV